MSLIANLAGHIRPYNAEIAFAIVATALIIFGGAINGAVRNLVKSWNVVLRVVAFILLCALGYGLLSAWLTGLLLGYLRGLNSEMLVLQVSLAFVVLGIMAERSRWK